MGGFNAVGVLMGLVLVFGVAALATFIGWLMLSADEEDKRLTLVKCTGCRHLVAADRVRWIDHLPHCPTCAARKQLAAKVPHSPKEAA